MGKREDNPRFNRYGVASEYTDPTRQLHPLIFEIRKRRIEIGISQTLLAEKMGYDVDTIRRWEQGLNYPSYRALIDWSDCLGVTMTIKDIEQVGDGDE